MKILYLISFEKLFNLLKLLFEYMLILDFLVRNDIAIDYGTINNDKHKLILKKDKYKV
jgi:hypothetical protein